MRRQLGAAIALMSLCGGAAAQMNEPAGSIMAAAGGRYVFGQVSNAMRDQFMLDTQTGRLWRLVCKQKDKVGNCIDSSLQSVLYQPEEPEPPYTITPAAPPKAAGK